MVKVPVFGFGEEDEVIVESEEEEEEEEEEDEKADSAMSESSAYDAVAVSVGLSPQTVKDVIEQYLTLTAEQMKKSGQFNLGGMLNLKLKVKLATKARKGISPFNGKSCIFKAKRPTKVVKAIPMEKFNKMVN